MKKKVTALVLSLVLVLGVVLCFASCSSGKGNNDGGGSTTGGAKASDIQYIKDKGTMIIGITEYKPMNYKENGEWTGFDTEFAEAVCAKLGVKAEFFLLADWDGKISELNAKTIDVVWNGMTITDDLKKGMDISDAYVLNEQVVVCKAENAAKYATADSIKDAKIAVEKGSAAEELVEGFQNVNPVQYQSDALLEVKSGAADVAIVDITMANSMTGEGSSYSDLTKTVALSSEEYGIGARKDTDTVQAINEVIKELKADGTLQKLADKYGLTLA